MIPDQTFLTLLLRCVCLERGQGEGVAAVLEAEDAHEEAVGEEDYRAPKVDGCALRRGVCHARDLEGDGDCGKCQDAVCGIR